MKNISASRKGNTSLILTIIVLVVVIAGGYLFFVNRTSAPANPEPGNTTPPPSASNTKTYTDPTYGFSFSYDPAFFVFDGVAQRKAPPDYTENIAGVRLLKQIPLEHCDLSGLPGSCTPQTNNINIGFFVISKGLDSLAKPLRESLGDIVKDIVIGGKKGIYTELGVEGEGIFEYYIPVDSTHTLLISRIYMSEDVLGKYKESPLFIKYADQAKIFENVMKTVNFK